MHGVDSQPDGNSPTRIRGPLVGAVFVVGALSVAGVPPAAGYIGKLELITAAHDQPAVLILLVGGALLSLVYAFQIYQYDFWRAPSADEPSRWRQRVVPVGLAVVVVAVGVWPEPVLAFSQAAAAALSAP